MSAERPEEILVDTNPLPWIPIVEGIDFKLLFVSRESGRWTVLFRCQPGSSFPIHKHYGAGEYYVTKGHMVYRMGEAREGTYGYEPLTVTHEHTAFPEYTELLFTNYGPVAFLNDEGGVAMLLDHQMLEQMATAHAEKAAAA